MRKLVQLALRSYKRWISPMLPVSCRYVPTCSEYAEEAIERFGLVRGSAMAAWRLLRCNPFGGSGWDPVIRSGATHSSACDTRLCNHFHSETTERALAAHDAPRFVSR